MKYQIEKRRGLSPKAIWTHHVKDNGYIVFRGTQEQCENYVQGAMQADLARDDVLDSDYAEQRGGY